MLTATGPAPLLTIVLAAACRWLPRVLLALVLLVALAFTVLAVWP